jgi:hypothetical protein
VSRCSNPAHRHRRIHSPTTYSDAELGEKQTGFGGVLVFCNGASISLLDESIGYQAIDVLFEVCSTFTRVTACTLALSPYFVTRYPKASATSLPP